MSNVVGCKDLQDGGRRNEGRRGKCVNLWGYIVWLEARIKIRLGSLWDC